MEAAGACNKLPGCTSFSVISELYNGKVWAELGPIPITAGEHNQWWSTWAKKVPTAGKWKPQAPMPKPLKLDGSNWTTMAHRQATSMD